MQKIEKYARDNNIPVLLDDTAVLLYDVLTREQPKSVLEIGTAIGYSGSLILQSCDANLTTIEVDVNSRNIAITHFAEFGYSNRVNSLLGDAYEHILQLHASCSKFDFIFLDGPKGQYFKYLPYLIDMLNVGGVLFADNVLFKGKVLQAGFVPHKHRTIVVNMRKYLEEISTNPRYQSHIYNIGDGVAITKLLK